MCDFLALTKSCCKLVLRFLMQRQAFSQSQIFTLLEKWGFLTCHQNAGFAESVSGSHRKEQPFSCCTGGAAVAGCHPRPETDGRHFNSCISLRDTHAVTATAAAERQLAGSAASGIPAFAPAPAWVRPKQAQNHQMPLPSETLQGESTV